jgi:hypothetical protein
MQFVVLMHAVARFYALAGRADIAPGLCRWAVDRTVSGHRGEQMKREGAEESEELKK